MKTRTLAFSWLHGSLAAAHRDETGAVRSWTCPQPVGGADLLRDAVGQAIRHTGFEGRKAVFVVDHRAVLFHVQDTPPARGRLLDQVLERLVADQRFFTEPAVWCRTPLPTDGARERSLLALMPRSLFRLLEEAAAAHQLELVGVFPVAPLLVPALRQHASSPDDRLLLVADLGHAHALVFGQGDGRVLFSRSVSETHEPTGARLDQEINRTRYYIQQQLGVPVTRVVRFAFGQDAPSPGVDLSGPSAPACGSPLACAALDLARDAAFNFALRHARPPRWIQPAIAAGMATALTVSLAAAALVEFAVSHRQADTRRARVAAQLEREAAQLEDTVHREGQRLTAYLQTLGGGTPSVPALFPVYLQQRLPATFRLATLEIHPSTNGWKVSLEGHSRDRGTRFLSAVEAFESDLARGPFAVRVTDSTHRRTTEGGPARPDPRPPGRARNLVEPDEQPFHLTGVIQ